MQQKHVYHKKAKKWTRKPVPCLQPVMAWQAVSLQWQTSWHPFPKLGYRQVWEQSIPMYPGKQSLKYRYKIKELLYKILEYLQKISFSIKWSLIILLYFFLAFPSRNHAFLLMFCFIRKFLMYRIYHYVPWTLDAKSQLHVPYLEAHIWNVQIAKKRFTSIDCIITDYALFSSISTLNGNDVLWYGLLWIRIDLRFSLSWFFMSLFSINHTSTIICFCIEVCRI